MNAERNADQEFYELLEELYTALQADRIAEAENLRNRIARKRKWVTSHALQVQMQLLESCYFIHLGDDAQAEKLIEDLNEKDLESSGENSYYYYYFKGHIYFIKKDYEQALSCYEQAEPYLKHILNAAEPADFYYKLANTYYRLYIISLSIVNVFKSIDHAKSISDDKLLAKGRLLQGLNQIERKEYGLAEEYLRSAMQGQTDASFIDMIHHNLGYLYVKQGQAEKAIPYLRQALSDRQSGHYLKSLYYLTEALFSSGQREAALTAYQEGFTISKEEKIDDYKWCFVMLQKQFTDPANFELVWEEGIKYFQKNADSFNVRYYAEQLAAYYTKNRQYENATRYYLLALNPIK